MTEAGPALMLSGGPVTPRELAEVARDNRPVSLGPDARRRILAARGLVEQVLGAGRVHYGINTGFGSLSRQAIPPEGLRELQVNLVRSHAAGVCEPFPSEIVRGAMLLAAASLARGASGVRLEVVEGLLALLNAGVTPIVPSVGSVGASGDLAPLAHLSLVLLGEGRAQHRGRVLEGGEALAAAGLKPLTLEAKEGLALLNGTHVMAAEAALLVEDWRTLLHAALVACGMSFDAYRATDTCLDARVFEARAQPGPADVARALRGVMAGSAILESHREGDTRVQDPYSFRCMPQVCGAAVDAWRYVKHATACELAAVTDNPLVFPGADGMPDVVSAGNFHGMPVAIPLDTLAIATSHVAGIAERRVFLVLAAREPESELLPYLAERPGVQSGLMIAQYTAAACCNELVGLANPASVANISTSAGVEDYNSFGPRAAAKARRGLELARRVVAIELLCAAEGLDFHRPLRSSDPIERAYGLVRSVVDPIVDDRPPGPDIERLATLVASNRLAECIREPID